MIKASTNYLSSVLTLILKLMPLCLHLGVQENIAGLLQ